MGMAILFRNSLAVSPFRDALIELCTFPGNEIIISTGYIKEQIFYDCSSQTYLNDLTDKIKQGFTENGQLINDGIIRIVGGRFWSHDNSKCAAWGNAKQFNETFYTDTDCYLCNFNHFYDYVSNFFFNTPIKVYRTHDSTWHAKIAAKIIVNNGKSTLVGAIIGSSNLTRQAFGVTGQYFNAECDVYMWNRRRLSPSNHSRFDNFSPEDIINYRNLFDVLPIRLKQGISEKHVFELLLKHLSNIRV